MNKPRLRQFLALFLVLCMLCSTTLPIYAEVPTGEVTPVETSVSVSTPENAASDAGTEKSSDDASSLSSATPETALSEAAQAFVDAVAALDREGILTAINAWGLASQAWQADQSNAELTAALEAATEASDAAAAPVYAAEDLYMALSDEEREIDAVKAAYSSLTALFISMQLAMQNPVAPGGGGDEPDLEEIATVLYGDLPDAPTGSYMGEYGLPVATGDTKISISAWKHDLLDASSKGRLDADALNETNAVMTVAKQDGTDYAIVPIAVQVEYPANGATTTVTLPDSVELLSYTSTAENLVVASEKERAQILNASYKDSSASASGFYVKATEDFSVTFTYSAPDGTTMSKNLNVTIDGNAEATALPASNSNGVSTYANTPQPPFTTGKITKIEYVVSTWLVWFNGVEAYCCDNGLYAAPGGCPTYSFAYVSKLEPGQYTPGNHYANQVNIWGGLNQLSMGLLSKSHDANDFAGSSFAASAAATYSTTGNEVLKTAYEYYNDTQLWIIEHYPNSVAAQTYMKAAAALENNGLDARPYLGNGGYYAFAYFPPAGYNWQRIVVIGPEIDEDDDTSELPETPEMQYYSADWTAPPQSASGSFDLTYTVHIDKSANITHEKLDDAIFKLTPNPSSGTISGGTWTIGDPQIVTTVDGAASATWTLHYEVTKTSTTTLSGKEGPYNTQEEANAAAEAAKNNAIAQLQNEAQAMVDAAIAEAKAQLAKITIDYEETTVPHGFDPTDSSSGSVSVPSNGSATAVVANQPWQAHVTWEKRDALTGGLVDADTTFEIQEWNPEKGEYEKSTHYQVVRREDGKYTVHLIGDAFFEGWEGKQGVLYYHQANQGKYRIVELKAPASYNLKAWEHNNWVIGWSEEIIVHPDYPTYEFLGETASRNMPYKTKVLIKKVDDATGEFILPDTTWTLYEWNERNNQYEVSTNYKIVRREDGYYTVTTLHSDWTHYEEGYLYFEDTQTDYPDSGRWFSNEGKFLIVESQAPAGYYGDYWRNDEPGTHSTDNGSDLGKRGYAFTLTEDNGTLWLTNADYNAKILYNLDEGNATVVLADGRPTSVIINEKQQPSYERDETGFGNTAKYGYVVFDRSQYNKKWAQTGDDDTYTTSYEATTSKLGDKIAAPEDTLWKNGKLYELEDYVTDLISGPVYYDMTLENIKSLDEVPSTMEYQLSAEKTITLALVSADWLEEPRSSYTGFVDLGYSPKQPTANETETITADDGHTFTGHLVGIEQTGDYGWVDMEIPATYYGWPDVKGIFLGNLVLPHNDNKPVYEGYETEILTYLGFNNKDYKIVDAEWTGKWEALPGSDMMNRSATFTISVYATGWIARYEEGEEGERTGTVTASYSFEDTASQEDGLYHWLVTAHYKPASVWTVLQAAAAVLGIGLVIAAVVLILFILSRKRKEKKRTTEKV